MSHLEVVHAYVEAFNAGDSAGLTKLFTPDALIKGVLGWFPLQEALPVWKELHGGLEIYLQPEAIIEQGDTVVARFLETGRFVGPSRAFPDVAPNGKTYEVLAMEWFDFTDGLISKRWGARDFSNISRQVLG